MSPEQVNGNLSDIDERTDVYSFGATLYHLATRQVPFPGRSIPEILCKVIDENLIPPSPNEINQGISQALSDLIMRCLSRHSRDRYQTMEEVLLILQKQVARICPQ
jgi:serine/threonine-protein kinase